MEVSKEKEVFFNSDIKLSMDCDISINNMNNFTVHNESVLDLSLTPNSNESFPQYGKTNSHLSYGLTNCTTMYSDLSDIKDYYSVERTLETISSNHQTISTDSNDSGVLNSGNYIPNIPTPEQLLTSNEETSYNLHGQINFVNLFRQTWYYYQQYLIQPNYSSHTTYLPTDDYQCYVHNNQPMFTSSQSPNSLISQYNATHYHSNDSEYQTEPSIHSIPDTTENNIPVSNYSKPVINTNKNDKITSNGSESPGDKPRQYRKARAYFHPKQMSCLESFFQKNPYLSTRDREYLSRKLNLSEDRIRTWFQNRRMREKRKPGINYDFDNSSMNSFEKIDYS
ncbi:putative homeobox protein [Schistosoma mansoni]|uniref:putative homeobox protein n=1 Tax=Schistosoma mansoni TaxID=6183 RepID=UPI0001A63245|nr:putative homeobox protein [Schistosoma mansoni]|eukprot:XP_018649200.1 putative homeobox protein [Schistosoma mansoni]